MALESLFRGEGVTPNTGKYISIPQTSLEKLKAYKFAYIADKAIKEGRGDKRVVLGVGKSALELAMGDMGQYNPHELPKVHRSFKNAEAIAETAADYSQYFAEAYESASLDNLLTLFDEARVFNTGTAKIAREKIKPYADMSLKQLDELYKAVGGNLESQRDRGNKGEKMHRGAITNSNQELRYIIEVASLIKELREKYEMILTEEAKARASQEAFADKESSLWGIMRGPEDISGLGHHLMN